MATKEELAGQLARQLAERFSQEIFGAEGPALDTDIDEIEEVAVLAARATFDEVIAQASEFLISADFRVEPSRDFAAARRGCR